MKKLYLILYLICFNLFSLSAIEGLKFENITNKDGLSHNTVRCVMQDSRGFMWISTINGLNRFDGHQFLSLHPEFNTPSLTENNIRQTFEDQNGRIWIQSTSRFVNCYDTNIESFADYTGKNEARNYYQIKAMPDGDVWLWGLENGACHIHYKDNKMISTLYDIDNIGTNVVTFVLKDSSGQIWIGTDKGLVQIINNIPRFCNTGNHTYNYHSVVELQNQIYFFTNNDAILVFDKLRSVFLPATSLGWKNFKINHTSALDEDRILITGKQSTLILETTSVRITSARALFNGEELSETFIHTDNKNNPWVYNKTGNIWHYQPETGAFKKYRLIPESIISIIDLERFDVYCDSRGIFWITTFGNGLFTIEPNGEISHFTTANSGLKNNYLLSVKEDRTGDIWIGTENTGIAKISLTKYNNKIFLPDLKKTDYSDRTIRSIFEDATNGEIWIGTKSGDIYVFDKDLKQKSTFQLRQGAAYSITPDTAGNIWVGTKGNGLLVIPKGKRKMSECYIHLLSDDHKTGANNIYTVLCDSKGRMWIGTFGDGLYLYELKDGKLNGTRFPRISNKQKQVRYLIQDHSGLIWAGGENGVTVFDPDTLLTDDSRYDWLHFDKNNPKSLNNNIVKTMLEDSQHRIWIGTSGGGLNLATKDPATNTYELKHYTSEEGLINNMIQAMLEDNNQNIWISTESGISKFNPADMLFENYSFLDVWESDLFCEAAAYKRKNGDLLFGSYNGMYIFNPVSFEAQTFAQPVSLTGLSINGVPVSPNTPDSPLSESITQTKTIRLKNGQNSFSIEFSSLNFQSSHSNRYSYILENYDKGWNPITQYNVATYKNIPAGKYRFKVKNANNPSPSLESTELEVIVVPPFWKSTNAFILYVILLLVTGFFAIKLIIKMNKLHNEVEVEKKITEYRLRFFTNISHEFRTPLTIIRGSIESMAQVKPLPPILKKQLRTLEKSSSKLMRLIDQLLEFRKMQNDQMDLRLEEIEAVDFLRGIYELFQETADQKRIHFSFSSNQTSKRILLDEGKIEKIVFNLLSNAFKHTPEGGNIALSIDFDDAAERFILKVSDSGIGIPPEKRDLLFVRFKQINYSSSGIGIGLHLTAELTRVHKGEIEYSDSEWGGACFTVTIRSEALHPGSHAGSEALHPGSHAGSEALHPGPHAGSEALRPGSHADSAASYPPLEGAGGGSTPSLTIDEHETVEENKSKEAVQTRKYKILLIEDDEEIRSFLEDQLSDYFTVSTASNGLLGWEAATHGEPSLIVCDVMMPEMDGFEVTRKLKSDFQTSHIPIILLTAHSSMEHQLEGINAGADAYIIKPFSTTYLISRIIKLIEQREKLQYKFAHEPGMIQTTICTTDKDNEFIKKMHDIIEKHLDDPDFLIDDFAQAANMGRTIFYKKIKGITNYSPNEYLRIIRLKKAAELLKTTELNVSEIAYKVGFNDPDYFSKCFKDLFGMRPTQFRTEKEDNITR
ncbi:two-component regulator propeller domain-containing protein [Bacteroides sp. 51]|uniref:two-component regulator propeller domain-containing protein n=1 Tax=Bacteroides sp. 51 TaxID=2302938 RepID=UPI0013D3FF01|nr:two-component regulator propeller domain-containing protein [Bacteroides sp. 51]NDV83682.1 response regulator [Bacteroides sp. 51]